MVSKDADSFEIVIASTGARIRVGSDQTALQALEMHGARVTRSGCRLGTCGACRTGILKGIPDHRDDYLTLREREGGKVFLPCCSRSLTSELVLDL